MLRTRVCGFALLGAVYACTSCANPLQRQSRKPETVLDSVITIDSSTVPVPIVPRINDASPFEGHLVDIGDALLYTIRFGSGTPMV